VFTAPLFEDRGARTVLYGVGFLAAALSADVGWFSTVYVASLLSSLYILPFALSLLSQIPINKNAI
jgi:hypothetical protein